MGPVTNAEWIATRLDGVVYPFQGRHHEWLLSLLAERSEYGVYAFEPNLLVILRRGHPKDSNREVGGHLLCTVQAEDLNHKTGHVVRDENACDGSALMFKPGDGDGFAAFGYYRDLPAGTYQVTFRIRARAAKPGEFACLEVSENRGQSIRTTAAIRETIPRYTNVVLKAVLSGEGGVEFRIRKSGAGYLWADQITWERQEDPAGPRPASP